ncbi:Replication protein A 70 kDa DNA-binding subunit B [Bienertia sinuspersici]
MKGVLFDRDIDLFRETLVEGKEYDITNPIIARIPEMFKRTEQVYQMTINTQISETQSAVELPSYLIPLTKVGDYIGKNERIDIIGIAVHMHDKAIVRAKSSGIPYEVRKVEMLDTEMQVIQLSIWNTLVTTEAEQIAQIIDTLPILEISRVTATTYNGDTGESSQQLQPCVSVQQLSEQQSGTTAWITGKIKDITNKNSLIYNACNVCNKRCEASTGLPFTCHAFSTPHSATSEPRCVVHIDFEDESGNIPEQRSFVDNHIADLQDKIFKIEMTTYMLGENTQQLRWKAKRIVEAQS